VALLGAPVAQAQAPLPTAGPKLAAAGLDDRRRELADLRRRLADLKARFTATRRKEQDLREALRAADLDLEIRTAERRMLELQTADAERSAALAALERDTSAKEVAALRQDLAMRIAALYRMGRLGYLRTLVVAESGRTFLRGLEVLTHLAKKDAALLAAYETSLATLETRERTLGERRRELAALTAESRAKEQELTAARAVKAALLTRVTRAAESERVAVASLEERWSRLASLLDLLETHGRALAPGAASIRRYRGVLDWPAKGKVVVPFGRIANPSFPKTFLRSSGWTIDAPPGSEARAIFAGDVAFAQWLKGYGNLVVIDHGDGVFTLYGRLATGSTVARGARVGVGDVVGQVGPSPEDEVPGLYFEVRDARSSVDPKLWLK
jgi:septal ring factor EnvC (AmiA/AmiB activator)